LFDIASIIFSWPVDEGQRGCVGHAALPAMSRILRLSQKSI
jgi:hypothetical protein